MGSNIVTAPFLAVVKSHLAVGAGVDCTLRQATAASQTLSGLYNEIFNSVGCRRLRGGGESLCKSPTDGRL